VTADAAVEDYATLAGVFGVLVEILEERNAGLEERNADLEQRNGKLSAQLAGLLERVAKLERQVSRNSGNSGMPPSADDLPGRTAPDPKPERGRGGNRRQGKQPGAPGAHLARSENPDDTLPVYPCGECGCGRDLGGAL
jgi:transposase